MALPGDGRETAPVFAAEIDAAPFVDCYSSRHADAPKPGKFRKQAAETAGFLLDAWGPRAHPAEETVYSCSPHRIEMLGRLVRDDYLPKEGDEVLALLPDWVQWCSDRAGLPAALATSALEAVESKKMGHDYGGIAHFTAKGAAGRTGLSQAASGRALRRLEETGLIIGNGDGDAWRTSGASSGGEWHDRFGGRNRLVVRPDRDGSASARLRGRCTSPCLWRSGHPAGTQRPLSE